MIRHKTRLKVADNTGMRLVECISSGVYEVGSFIRVAVKEVTPAARKYFKQPQLALVVRTVSKVRDGSSYVSFSDNAVVMVNQAREPLGTRVFGPVSRAVFRNPHGQPINTKLKSMVLAVA